MGTMQSELSFEEELNAEVTKRLALMEDPAYEFPERMKKVDWIVAGVLIVVSLIVVELATLTAGGM